MLIYLAELAKKFYRKKTLKNHLHNLENNCIMGEGFCTSPAYPSRELQLLNVKIKNKTGDRSKIKFGTHCNVSVKIFLNTTG